MGEVVKTPCEGDLADVPGLVGGVGKIALATLQPLRLDVTAERGLFGGHQIAGVTRRDSCRRRSARQRQFGIGEMRQDMILEAIEQRRPVDRLVRQARVQPVGKRHREQVERLVEQAACGRGIDLLDRPAHIAREIIGQPFERTITGECGRGQTIERADALLQQLARHLEDGLRKTVVETQFVGASGVVKDELSGGDDRLAAVLEDAVHAAVAHRHKHEIFAGARNSRRRAEHPLGGGIDLRERHRSDSGLRHRAPERAAHVRFAVEPDKGVADDVLPHRKPALRKARTGVEHNSHDGPPRTIRMSCLA